MVDGVPVTVVEVPHFIRQAAALLSEQERLALIEQLAWNPESGVVMPGTGGVRKVRWGVGGRGKSSGARVIYYYHNATMPIFLLGIFAKSVKVDLDGRREAGAAAPHTGAGAGLSGEEPTMKTTKRTVPVRLPAGEAVPPNRPGQSLIAAMSEAIDWSHGDPAAVRAARQTTVRVPNVDVQRLRQSMRLSQAEFAARFGFAPASVRNWEQGRRQPEGPARVLLAIIARHPEVVEDVLHHTE